MRVFLLANAHSGRGRGRRVADAIQRALADASIDCDRWDVMRDGTSPEIDPDTDVILAIGGDGTVQHAIRPAMDLDAALYHVPMGNENLFAREFAMVASPGAIVERLRAHRTRTIDVGVANGRLFSIMCSVGLDAGVIARLHRTRTRAQGIRPYIGPVLGEMRAPSLGVCAVEVDGEVLVDGERGVVVVANSRQYAWRIDPVSFASVDDGRLDVVFMRMSRGLSMPLWAVRSRLRRHLSRKDLRSASGRHVRIETDGPIPWQIDGEAPAHPDGSLDTTPLDVTIRASSLRVLC